MNAADILPALAGAAMVAGAALFALLPLLRPVSADLTTAPASPGVDRFQLYRNVLELELDYEMGKLSAEDYDVLSGDLLSQAAAQLRESRGKLEGIDEEVEREIAAARRAFSSTRAAPPAAVPSEHTG